ncbi:hypothetical protein [Frankia sp. QA3]|uniref:hypothetical protein n=1 Tax=Frankia sp. QA3 TaxID=710111 RepID=UPI000269B8B7|nr:hypothetical protein [Frankia sp. QA3]EIV90820.1 hypothetical protein FraQA3DRAFT_0226 [Frankia sp. QA3]
MNDLEFRIAIEDGMTKGIYYEGYTSPCTTCGQIKYIGEMVKDSRARLGYRKTCKQCAAARSRERRESQPEIPQQDKGTQKVHYHVNHFYLHRPDIDRLKGIARRDHPLLTFDDDSFYLDHRHDLDPRPTRKRVTPFAVTGPVSSATNTRLERHRTNPVGFRARNGNILAGALAAWDDNPPMHTYIRELVEARDHLALAHLLYGHHLHTVRAGVILPRVDELIGRMIPLCLRLRADVEIESWPMTDEEEWRFEDDREYGYLMAA